MCIKRGEEERGGGLWWAKAQRKGGWWMEGLDGVTNQHTHQQRCGVLVGPLTPHQGKTVEGTCLGGNVVERSLDLGEVFTC